MKLEFGNPEHIAASRRKPTMAEAKRAKRLERLNKLLGGESVSWREWRRRQLEHEQAKQEGGEPA